MLGGGGALPTPIHLDEPSLSPTCGNPGVSCTGRDLLPTPIPLHGPSPFPTCGNLDVAGTRRDRLSTRIPLYWAVPIPLIFGCSKRWEGLTPNPRPLHGTPLFPSFGHSNVANSGRDETPIPILLHGPSLSSTHGDLVVASSGRKRLPNSHNPPRSRP